MWRGPGTVSAEARRGMWFLMQRIREPRAPKIPLAPLRVVCFNANALHLIAPPCSVVGRVFASLVAALYFALSLAAVDHTLHACLHADADQPGHRCFLTLVSHSQVESTPTVTEPAWFGGPFRAFAPSTADLPKSSRHWLPPGRGPPIV